MKVYELIDRLLSFNQELPIAYWDNEYSRWEEITEIKIVDVSCDNKGNYEMALGKIDTIEIVTLS